MAIFHRLLLAFLAVGVLIGVPLIVVSLDFSRDSARLRTEQSVTQQVAIVAANFEQEFGLGLNRSLKQITSSEALTHYLSASQDERIVNARGLETSFLKSQTDYDIYSGIYYVDVHGQQVASVEDGKRVSWPVELQPGQWVEGSTTSPTAMHFQRLFDRITTTPSLLSSGNMEWFMPPRQMAVEGPFIDEQGRWSLLAGLPALDFDNGALSGAAVIRVRLDVFLSRLKTLTLFDEQVIWLFDSGSQVLIKPERSALALTRADVGDTQLAKELVLSKRDDDLIAYRDLAIVPEQAFLRIVYGVPSSLLSRDFEPALYFFILVLGISSAAVLTVAYFVAKNLSAPVIKLAQAASRLSRGESAERVEVHTSGELMVLVNSFNSMSENLQLANESRANAFAVLRETAVQMQSAQTAPGRQDNPELDPPQERPATTPAPGQEDVQDLRAISQLISQLIDERAENLRTTQAALDSAEQANRAKSQFLANMSHEIRTPLNAVLGMLRLLQSTSLNARQTDYVAKTEGAAKSLLFLLNDILDFSKIEANKMTLDPRPFRLDQVMRDLSVILSVSVGAKPVEVLFDIDPRIPRVLIGDDLRLQQVLINLAGNAIKFTEQGEVVIGVRTLDLQEGFARIQVFVRDTGIGIPAEQHDRIFDGFSQAESSTTRRFGGTGLGLSICQRLVGLMGGIIQLDSEPGRGSTFSFQIALAVAESSESQPVPATDDPDSQVQRMRTLVVDDSPTARQLLSEMVTSLGWEVELAPGGAQALALVQQRADEGRPYDVVLMDGQMPDMDGWETSLRMRQAEAQGSSSLVLMVTAHGRETLANRSAAERASLSGFLVKPITASMLLDAVQEAQNGLAGPTAEPRANPPAPMRLAGLRLLVVEDNANNRQVAEELLRAEGAQVTLVENGEKALEELARAPADFEAVLMDLQMPVMDGFTATARLRADPRWETLPVIAMTANAMASDRQACLDAGMSDHVGKPFDLNDLVGTLLKHTRPGAVETPKATQAVSMPKIPAPLHALAEVLGLELEKALQRLGGHVGTYSRMWRNFLSDLPPMLASMSAQCAAGEWTGLGQTVHTLKGLSGMLGVPGMVSHCLDAERALKQGSEHAPSTDWLSSMQQWGRTLEQHQDALLSALEALQAPVVLEGASLSEQELAQTLSRLSQLLKNSDMRGIDAFDQLRSDPLLARQPMFSTLQTAIDRLEFERAAGLVTELRQALQA